MLEYERKPAEGAPALEPERVKVIGIGGAGCKFWIGLLYMRELMKGSF